MIYYNEKTLNFDSADKNVFEEVTIYSRTVGRFENPGMGGTM